MRAGFNSELSIIFCIFAIAMQKEIKKWETLKSEYLFRRPWLTARRDAVELPDGRIHDEFYILEYPEWINTIARTPEGNFVMVRQYRHGTREVLTELCAGVVEPGEDIEAAARRELLEETGFGGGIWTKFDVYAPNASAMTNHSHTFIAEGVTLQSDQHLDPTEDIAVEILTPDELMSLMKSGQIKQTTMAAPLWHYFFNLARAGRI